MFCKDCPNEHLKFSQKNYIKVEEALMMDINKHNGKQK